MSITIRIHNKKLVTGMRKQIRRAFPQIVEDIAVRAELHTMKAFREEGFTDRGLDKWPKRKTLGRYDEAARTGRRAILVKTAKLRNSTKYRRERMAVRITNTARSPKGFAYGLVHNEGLPSRGIPRRRFIGNSYKLNREIAKKSITPIIKRALGGR